MSEPLARLLEAPILLIGNPRHKRVASFARAVIEAGLPSPVVRSHEELVARPDALLDLDSRTPRLVRVESAGQNEALARALWLHGAEELEALGGSVLDARSLEADPPTRFELRAPLQLHLGFMRYLGALGRVLAERPQWTAFTPPHAIALAFDKNATAHQLQDAQIPTAHALTCEPTVDALLEVMRRAGAREVFVKLAHASSASGLAVLRRRADGGVSAWSTADLQRVNGRPRFFNSRRVRRYDDRRSIDALVGFLLRERARVEVGLRKPRIDGKFVDLRVLVVGREVGFWVARGSSHPITNLHLGATPLPRSAFRARVDPGAWRAARADCVRAADLFEAFHLGIDLVFEPGLRRYRVLEVNAFGDLLPRERRHGLDPYAWQVNMLRSAAA